MYRNPEAELRRLAAIVASSADAIIGTSLDGTITTWNHAAEVIFGYRPEEVIGRSVFIFAASGREDEMPLILDRIREGQEIIHYETARRHKLGKLVEISLTVSPVHDEDGSMIGAFNGGGPTVRIHLPPAASLVRTVGRPRKSEALG